HLEALDTYLDNPVDYSTLVFIAPYEKIDSRKKITKKINKNGLVAECAEIKEYELDKWIKSLADSMDIQIAPDVYELFVSELQLNLQLIQSELTKIAM